MEKGGQPIYPTYEGLIEAAAAYSPIMAGVLKDMRGLIEPAATSLFGMSPYEMGNPLQRQLSTSMFTKADAAVWERHRRDYTALTGGVRSDTPISGIINAINREYLDKASMGATAYALAMQHRGVGMSFATSVLGEPRPLAFGATSAQDITSAFADTAGMPFKGLRPGERQMLLERMVRTDRSLLTGYAGDMTALRDITTTDNSGMLTPKNMSFTKETTDILERVNGIRKGVREMDSAVAAWKEVLNRDVKQSLEALGALFGGDAVATFSGSGDVLQRMALRVRHTAALTGVEPGYLMGGVGSAMKMLGGIGAPQEAALLTTTFATGYAANLGGYKAPQQLMEQAAAFSAGHAIASPYGRMLQGAYMRYMGTEEGYKLGYGEAGRAGFRRWLGNVERDNGVYTAETLNKAFGGAPLTDADYRKAADTDPARDFASQDDLIVTEVVGAASKKARDLYFRTAPRAREVATAVGESTFFAAMSKSPEMARAALDRALSEQGWSLDQRRPVVSDLLRNNEQIVTSLRRGRTGGWENLADMSVAATMNFLNPDVGIEYANRRAEVEARTQLSMGMSRSGSLLMAGVDLFRDGGNVSIKGLFSAVTGISGREADLFYSMGGTDKAQREQFVKAMQGLPGRIEDDVDPDKLVKYLFGKLRTSYDKGDRAGIRAAQADITSVLGGQFIEGKFTFEGGAPTGSASDAVQKYKDSISDESLKELIYRQAESVKTTDYTGKVRDSDEQRELAQAALLAGKSLSWAGMRPKEIDVAAISAAAVKTMEGLATQDTVDAYRSIGDDKYQRGTEDPISAQQYRRMKHGASISEQLSSLIKDPEFLAGNQDKLTKGVNLMQQTDQGGVLLEKTRSLAGSSSDMSTWTFIIRMFIDALRGVTLKTEQVK